MHTASNRQVWGTPDKSPQRKNRRTQADIRHFSAGRIAMT
jgi:hypothetical protein